jgi:hypothetical protein
MKCEAGRRKCSNSYDFKAKKEWVKKKAGPEPVVLLVLVLVPQME